MRTTLRESGRLIRHPDRCEAQTQTEKLLHRDAVQNGMKLLHVGLLQMCLRLPNFGRSSVFNGEVRSASGRTREQVVCLFAPETERNIHLIRESVTDFTEFGRIVDKWRRSHELQFTPTIRRAALSAVAKPASWRDSKR